ERDGPYWKIAHHVRPDSDFWAWFVSDHYDETLNPSLYLDFMRPSVRDMARANADAIIGLHVDANGQRHSRQWFADKTHELRTYWGVNYGHRGDDKDLIMIHEICFKDGDAAATENLAESLHGAIENPKKLEQLCGGGANVNAPDAAGRTPLHWAARARNVKAIDVLLAYRADPKLRDRDGRTALFDAAGTGDAKVVAALLRGGADPNAVDAFHATPLHAAVHARGENVADVVDQLVHAGASIDSRDDFGCTALHGAVRRGDEAIVAALLDAGADANIADSYGATPLHLTASRGFGTMARLLMEHGANVQARAGGRGTPIEVAVKSGHDQLAAVMRASTGPQNLSIGARR
ncbi:MAG: ankyrin repeat domain-containing protein, partial [Anaerolineae bacterium]|nr:ankyrin repeat domain-containing protein [Phycisphaerae bacterium]